MREYVCIYTVYMCVCVCVCVYLTRIFSITKESLAIIHGFSENDALAVF